MIGIARILQHSAARPSEKMWGELQETIPYRSTEQLAASTGTPSEQICVMIHQTPNYTHKLPEPNSQFGDLQYLERRLSSETCCTILAAASQLGLEELAARACAVILLQFSAATCPPQLVHDIYSLDYHPFVHLLRVANETVPVLPTFLVFYACQVLLSG
jgi:hypothetical protein